MLRLRRSILTQVLSSSSVAVSNISSLHRLHSTTTTAPRISSNPSFAVEDYLVDTCGLTRAQALRTSPKLAHLKFPSKPDAVLAFLAGLGLSGADAAAAIVKDPKLLCAGVEKTLSPVVEDLTGLGLSRPDIARLLSLARDCFRQRSIVSKLQYYLPLFGSPENLFRALKHSAYLLTSSVDKVVNPNVVFLRQCGLSDCDIAKLCFQIPRMLTANPERVRAMVACAEGLGVPRGSGMFKLALRAVAFQNEEKIAAKVECLKNTFRWSDHNVGIAVCKAPVVLRVPKHELQRRSDFLFSEVGLEPMYIAHRPIMLCLSLEGRLRPRYYLVKFLKENGLLDRKWSYNSIILLSEKRFVEKFICPHQEAAPHLAEDYAAACAGEVPARLIFASTDQPRT
jgi:mTERF domain-containing protein